MEITEEATTIKSFTSSTYLKCAVSFSQATEKANYLLSQW